MELEEIRTIFVKDESRFCLGFHGGRRRVWRRPGERFADCCVSGHGRFGGGSFMVWAGISFDGCTEIQVIEGTMTALRSRETIPHPIVNTFAGAIRESLIKMDNNVRPHRGIVVRQYLVEADILRMNGPALFLDMNPIEHAWDALQRRISDRNPLPSMLHELTEALIQEWTRILFQDIRNIILSFQ